MNIPTKEEILLSHKVKKQMVDMMETFENRCHHIELIFEVLKRLDLEDLELVFNIVNALKKRSGRDEISEQRSY